MLIVDTHCHLYLEEFDADRDALVKAACDKGIGHIYLPAIDSETHQRVIDTGNTISQRLPRHDGSSSMLC